MVYVFLYLSWIVTQPQILPQLLRNCWDVSLEIKVDWHADQSFISSAEIAGSTSPNWMKMYQSSCFTSWEYVCLYLFLWPLELITCRRHRNRNGCLSMGLENAYCLFGKVIINTASEGCYRQYFILKTTQILPINLMRQTAGLTIKPFRKLAISCILPIPTQNFLKPDNSMSVPPNYPYDDKMH